MKHLKIFGIGLGRTVISIVFVFLGALPLYIYDHYNNTWFVLSLYFVPLIYWIGSIE